MSKKIPIRSIHYQWESLLYRKDLHGKEDYKAQFAYKVLSRDKDGFAKRIRFDIYVNNPNCKTYLVGKFNDWGRGDIQDFLLEKHETGFESLVTDKIKHKESYLFLIKYKDGKELVRDPSATYFDNEGNCVFWDFEDPTTYSMKYEQPNTLKRPTIILQTDPLGLVAKWFEYDKDWKNLAESEYSLFEYIRKCGVLKKIKDLGFNTIQFLPVAQSIDGDNWKHRYLVTYPFALQKNWGNPDSFRRLVDECHRLGISVICDLILSHCPFKDFKIFSLRGEDVGIHILKDKHNKEVYLDEYTPWGTMRFKYGDEHVRRYLTESALHFQKQYKIDGFRIDNVDGILRFGDNGQGDERPHGRQFLRELISSIYDFNPLTLIHLESHYFFGDNAKMLVAPLVSNPRALGASAYNSSRLTYFFHKEFMPKSIDNISIWKFEHIKEEKEWGESNSTIADFHNHDAAAGLMEGRATGSYAYDALVLKDPSIHFHAIGKIKVMESFIAFACEGRILDLMQTFLLQKGSFEHDSSIHWNLLNNKESNNMILFKKEINNLLNQPAFWPENTINRKYINVDDQSKVVVIKREDKTRGTGDVYYCLINLSNKVVEEYAIGLDSSGEYEVVFDSEVELAGSLLKTNKSDRFEVFPYEVLLKPLKPYQVFVIKKNKRV